MNILGYLNDLRHDYHFLDDLFENVKDFNNLFDCGEDGNRLVLISIDCLDAFFDVVARVSLGYKLLDFNDLVSIDDDFLDPRCCWPEQLRSSPQEWHLQNLLVENRNFNSLLADSLNDLVNFDNNRCDDL
jgi:hypothetical protein